MCDLRQPPYPGERCSQPEVMKNKTKNDKFKFRKTTHVDALNYKLNQTR